jgi:hypothetical protein
MHMKTIGKAQQKIFVGLRLIPGGVLFPALGG